MCCIILPLPHLSDIHRHPGLCVSGANEIRTGMGMHKILLAVAALTAFAGVAEARDGCGRGFFFDGRRCVPMRAGPPVVVPPPYVAPPRYVAPPPRYVAPGPRGWRPAGPDRHGQMTYRPGPRNSCPPRYTVQDGLCKPYRGF
jgi:hypothetical protein